MPDTSQLSVPDLVGLWHDASADPEFNQLPPQRQFDLKTKFFSKLIAPHPDYQTGVKSDPAFGQKFNQMFFSKENQQAAEANDKAENMHWYNTPLSAAVPGLMDTLARQHYNSYPTVVRGPAMEAGPLAPSLQERVQNSQGPGVASGVAGFADQFTNPRSVALLGATGGVGEAVGAGARALGVARGMEGAGVAALGAKATRVATGLVSAGFSADTIHGAYVQYPHIREAYDQATQAEAHGDHAAAEHFTGLARQYMTEVGLSGLMAGMLAKHAGSEFASAHDIKIPLRKAPAPAEAVTNSEQASPTPAPAVPADSPTVMPGKDSGGTELPSAEKLTAPVASSNSPEVTSPSTNGDNVTAPNITPMAGLTGKSAFWSGKRVTIAGVNPESKTNLFVKESDGTVHEVPAGELRPYVGKMPKADVAPKNAANFGDGTPVTDTAKPANTQVDKAQARLGEVQGMIRKLQGAIRMDRGTDPEKLNVQKRNLSRLQSEELPSAMRNFAQYSSKSDVTELVEKLQGEALRDMHQIGIYDKHIKGEDEAVKYESRLQDPATDDKTKTSLRQLLGQEPVSTVRPFSVRVKNPAILERITSTRERLKSQIEGLANEDQNPDTERQIEALQKQLYTGRTVPTNRLSPDVAHDYHVIDGNAYEMRQIVDDVRYGRKAPEGVDKPLAGTGQTVRTVKYPFDETVPRLDARSMEALGFAHRGYDSADKAKLKLMSETIKLKTRVAENLKLAEVAKRAKGITETKFSGALDTLRGVRQEAPVKELTGDAKTNPPATQAQTTPTPAVEITPPSAREAAQAPASEVKEFAPGPGARTAGDRNETGQDNIDQLRGSLAGGSKLDLHAKGVRMGEDLAASAHAFRERMNGHIKSITQMAQTFVDSYKHGFMEEQPGDSDLRASLKTFQAHLQRNNFQLKEWVKDIKKSIKDPDRRAAISNYIQANGDHDTLLQRAQATKNPQLKRQYEIATQLNGEERRLGNNVRNYFDAMLEEGQKLGILDHGIKDYLTQIWEKKDAMNRQYAEIAMGKFQKNPFFAKKRVFDSYFDGEQAGFIPKNKDIGFLIGTYDQSFKRAIAARSWIYSLSNGVASDGNPLAAIAGIGQKVEGEFGDTYFLKPRALSVKDADSSLYKDVPHAAMRGWKWAAKDSNGNNIFMEGNLKVHKEAYRMVNAVMGKSAMREWSVSVGGVELKPGAALLTLSHGFKETMLSLSLFHQTTIGVHALEHGVSFAHLNPLPNSGFKIDLDDATQQKLIYHGLTIAPEYHVASQFQEGLSGRGGLLNLIPGVGRLAHAYTEYLFGTYIPRVKMAMATHALQRNMQRYAGKLSPEKIHELTAKQANAAFGGQNAYLGHWLAADRNFQDIMHIAFLAPDFNISRMKFAGQALSPYGREQSTALIRGAAVLYVGARMINKIVDDDYHTEPEHAFSIIHGGEEFRLRTVQGDMMHAATDPGNYFRYRVNPLVGRTGIEWLTGRDEYGRPRTGMQQLKDTRNTLAPIPFQGWLKNPNQVKLWHSLLTSAGITVSPEYRKKVK